MRLKQLMREASDLADKMFADCGEIPGVFTLIDTPRGLELLVIQEVTPETKDHFVTNMPGIMRDRGAARYATIAEVWATPPIPYSSQLPKDEGFVFVTNVASSPIQVLGRRGERDKKLYVGNVIELKRDPEHFAEVTREMEEQGVEIVTGPEAEELLRLIQHRDTPPDKHPLAKDLVLLQAEDRTNKLTALRTIVRPEGRRPYLMKPEVLSGETMGRWTDLLADRNRLH